MNKYNLMIATKIPTDIFQLVFEIIRQIPKGRVTTYNAITRSLGLTRYYGVIKKVLVLSEDLYTMVPGHRVVSRLGILTNFHDNSVVKDIRISLESEGIEIEDGRVVNFDKVFWDPSTKLQ